MIGCTLPNNNVYVFFEEGEIPQLAERKIQGIHVNTSRQQSVLEVLVDEETCQGAREIVLVDIKPGEYVRLSIRDRVYDALQERGSFIDHQGYCHVYLKDVEKMDFHDRIIYNSLKEN